LFVWCASIDNEHINDKNCNCEVINVYFEMFSTEHNHLTLNWTEHCFCTSSHFFRKQTNKQIKRQNKTSKLRECHNTSLFLLVHSVFIRSGFETLSSLWWCMRRSRYKI
jgi:hypothetical protein